MAKPLTDGINALTRYANSVTGASDTTLSEAVATLANGYGQGGVDPSLVDSILDGTISGTYENDTVARLKFAIFRGCNSLQHVKVPNVTNFDGQAFYYCSNLESVSAISCISMGGDALRSCAKLRTITMPKLGDVVAGGMRDNPKLETVDIKGSVLRNSALQNCPSLEKVILRNTSVCMLVITNVFDGTPFASGGTGGTLYVPSALISSYQSANNWSTILGYANNQILPIEGSIYETQYADGTPIE